MRSWILLLLALGSLALTACASATPESVTRDDAATPIATSRPPTPIARATAPAVGDSFRADHPALVANTGRPQVIEFFSYN